MSSVAEKETLAEGRHDTYLGAAPLIHQLLTSRGITTDEEAAFFLSPDYNRDLHDPYLMKDMDKAVARILDAIKNAEHIVIYNDYDCDGIPGGVVLHDFFKKIGHEQFVNYIPHRYREGYGLHKSALEDIAQSGATLMITVDCGITDVDEVAYARELGIDVIVTDHHLPIIDPDTDVERVPDAYAVIDNKQREDAYPFKELCGAGTAFKLVQALLGASYKKGVSLREYFGITVGWEKWLLDMAGVATIADMVPLTGENRTLAYFGLLVLRKSRRPGILELTRDMRLRQHLLSEDDVGFSLAPRINAASRMGEPEQAFTMLATTDAIDARERVKELSSLNNKRKGLVAAMVKDAKRRIDAPEEVIVLGHPGWMPGLLGLAANSLMEHFSMPVFLWGRYGSETIKGSCRSDGTVSVVEVMSAVESGVFIDFGGHHASGGFSVGHEAVHTLEDAIRDALGRVEKTERSEQATTDGELALSDVTEQLFGELAQLAPFGMGNPKPVFLFRAVAPTHVKHFGKEGNHLELVFARDGQRPLRAIAFFKTASDYTREIAVGAPFDLLASLERNVFNGASELRLRIVDAV